jgi:hypothetical protein
MNLRASQAFTALSIFPTELYLYISDGRRIDTKCCSKANFMLDPAALRQRLMATGMQRLSSSSARKLVAASAIGTILSLAPTSSTHELYQRSQQRYRIRSTEAASKRCGEPCQDAYI